MDSLTKKHIPKETPPPPNWTFRIKVVAVSQMWKTRSDWFSIWSRRWPEDVGEWLPTRRLHLPSSSFYSAQKFQFLGLIWGLGRIKKEHGISGLEPLPRGLLTLVGFPISEMPRKHLGVCISMCFKNSFYFLKIKIKYHF